MCQLVSQIALVSEVPGISFAALAKAAAAFQKQVLRDFGPIWSLSASVDAFPRLQDVPVGYWPVIIRNDVGFSGGFGIHLDQNGQPFALVQESNIWTVIASHEILEMLADPFGNRLVAGNSIVPGQGRVEYLLEVCDPSEDVAFAYGVNGVMVSDFITPHFFDPLPAPGVRYSFTGAITIPRQIVPGGYLSWHDPVTNHWFQQSWLFGNQPDFVDLGVLAPTISRRSEIDRLTPVIQHLGGGLPAPSPVVAAAAASTLAGDIASTAKAAAWYAQIDALKRKYTL